MKARLVGDLVVALGAGRADAVAGVGLHPQDDRVLRRGRRLQAGGHLRRLPGGDARVVQAGGQQHRGIGDAVLHVLIGVHLVEGVETASSSTVPNSGMFGGPLGENSARSVLDDADRVDHHRRQLGPLGHEAADGDAAGRAADDRELGAGGVALGDQLLGAVDVVAPGVGLGRPSCRPGASPRQARRRRARAPARRRRRGRGTAASGPGSRGPR